MIPVFARTLTVDQEGNGVVELLPRLDQGTSGELNEGDAFSEFKAPPFGAGEGNFANVKSY